LFAHRWCRNASSKISFIPDLRPSFVRPYPKACLAPGQPIGQQHASRLAVGPVRCTRLSD
jgi:hypothetical protein